MNKQFVQERLKIAREKFRKAPLMAGPYTFLDTLIKDTILATEGELRKRVEGIKEPLPTENMTAREANGYNKACDEIISTLDKGV